MISTIAIEGVDRLGKSTLINGLLGSLGFFQVIHYEKPKLLNVNKMLFSGDDEERKKQALGFYQAKSFSTMFTLVNSGAPLILDRAHLGEVVYAPRYRGYSGEYVFDQEIIHREACNKMLLVLLTCSDFSFIHDDGQSFDFDKKEEEQKDFIYAWTKSRIAHKLLIDVNDHGKFRSSASILEQVINTYTMALKNALI